jgi:hypothetical protein
VALDAEAVLLGKLQAYNAIIPNFALDMSCIPCAYKGDSIFEQSGADAQVTVSNIDDDAHPEVIRSHPGIAQYCMKSYHLPLVIQRRYAPVYAIRRGITQPFAQGIFDDRLAINHIHEFRNTWQMIEIIYKA